MYARMVTITELQICELLLMPFIPTYKYLQWY